MIRREEYLNWLKSLQDKQLIKVITGVRRAGKSTLLELFRDELLSQKVKKSQIQFYNFEEEKNTDLRDWRKLHQYIEEKLIPTEMNYVFLDEVQKVEHFEEMAASLATKPNVDLYITGSNAFLLSGELATYLTGRYISLHILPLSFQEYSQLFPDEQNMERLFLQYMNTTAFPEAASILVDNPAAVDVYLQDLYDTILQKDICTRYEIRNTVVFNRIVKFLFDSVGSLVSATNIAAQLEKQGTMISVPTVINYLNYLTKCYILYPANRFEIKGRRLLENNDKCYVVDLGLRQAILGSSISTDIGHRLENVVYLELVRRQNGKVFVGKQRDYEVDFVVQKYGGGLEYYQVAYQVAERPEVLERELRPLRSIQDNYQKMLITMDPMSGDIDGIRQVNVVDWLLDNRGSESDTSL